ncbi:MAG: tRNA dihydrouridine synthase DusB [Clostridiaceae bacterium]|nr:tRNA dihydrouridine synthase DusB [Clostridiaceae bacterium]
MPIEFCGQRLKNPFVLAPMAGVTDRAFREVCRDYGATLCWTEMVSARALAYGDKKTETLLPAPEEGPCVVQLFGSEPDVMAEGVHRVLARCAPALIDINMGCPMPKIVDNGDGCALMERPELAAEIVSAVKRVSPVPVTVKFRAGMDETHIVAPEFARRMEAAGADALCVHGRTAAQRYTGKSDPAVIAAAKRSVSVPVMASGDAMTAESCLSLLHETGAALVMLARGTLGNPMLFADCIALWRGEERPVHTAEELLSALLRQAALMCTDKGERRAMPELRKHGLWYLARLHGAKPYKAAMAAILTMEDLRKLCEEILSAGLERKG